MINWILFIFGVTIVLLWFACLHLYSLLGDLEEGKEDKDLGSFGDIHWGVEEIKQELTDWEISQLKSFAQVYLDHQQHGWVGNHFGKNTRKPLHQHKFDDFVEKEFTWLKELVLYPEKMDKEREKMKLREDIEKKQVELSKME